MKNLFKKVFKWIIPYQMYNILKKLYLKKTWNRRGITGGGGGHF
jgi:hypothetical protein